MDYLLNSSVWIVAGVLFMLAELIIPGGVVVFIGLGCLVVAASLMLGLVSSWVTALTLFFVSSLALVISLRAFFMKFAGGDFSRGNTVELLDDLGQEATVLEPIGPGQKKGLIDFRGSSWQALSDGQLVEVGTTVKIVGLDNVTYIVESSTNP